MLEVPDDVREEHLPALQAPLEGRIVPSPYNFEFTGEDALRVMIHNSVAGAVVALHYRFKPRAGDILASADQFALASDRMHEEFEVGLGVGYLLNVVCFAEAGSPVIGQTFVKVDVIRGRGAAAIVLGTILQDYVTEMQPVAWPGSPIRSSFDVEPPVRYLEGTNPGAGAEISETVPTGARWELLAFRSLLTADATAATRRASLYVLSAGVDPFLMPQAKAITAGLAVNCYWMRGVGAPVDSYGTRAVGAWPQTLILPAGSTINTSTENMQAGDDWGLPRLAVREWLEAA